MSDDLLRTLRLLEEDYPAQPVVLQQADLPEINRLRSRLGMPLVDARLKVIGAPDPPAAEAAKPEPKRPPDHSEAREIHQAYRKKIEELEGHRAYAEEVSIATAGHGQTPVEPLATMGPGGGPLLCDRCKKPIVLEGEKYHGMTADVAWKKNPVVGWTSWILGGMVVEIQTNGTLRIYHGYPGRGDNHCCNIASREDDQARARFESRWRPEIPEKILAYLEDEFPGMTGDERSSLLDKIVGTMYSYDPGIGINCPSGSGQ